VADNYIGRMFGYFTPPSTADYVFFCSADDQAFLFLSTDEDPSKKVKIASEPQWNNQRDWVIADRRNVDAPENRSDKWDSTEWAGGNTIHLTGGTKYYIEHIWKEGGGGDNGSATFKLATAADPANGDASAFSGSVIGTYVDPGSLTTSPPLITQRPVGKHFAKGETVTLGVTADSPLAMTYQWYQNGVLIPGASGSSYTIPTLNTSTAGAYTVTVINSLGQATSATAIVSATDIALYAGVVVAGPLNQQYEIQYTTSLTEPITWTPLTTFTLTTSPMVYVDTSVTVNSQPHRYYQAVPW